ncbi:MAG: YciI family protein [Candidatus Hydrogenedentes bacterium]|nr:YciI family protein [Candidatus Hydrogenedentota bacterium]
MKFMCIAYEEEALFHDMPPEDWQALRQQTLDYVQFLLDNQRLITAHPLQSATTAATVRVRDGKTAITDGPFAETKEQIGGFFLIEAADFDEALKIAEKWPSAQLGTIEVRPIEEELRTERRYG